MDQEKHIQQSGLGQSTDYVCDYDPKQLYPIPRANKWQQSFEQCPYIGVDVWNAYEVSWLNLKGLPQVAIVEFRVPAYSPNIIESKSFKLYLNSFNLTRFESAAEVSRLMVQDLSVSAGALVVVELQSVSSGFEGTGFQGECIDEQDIEITHYEPFPELLNTDPSKQVGEQLVSHLLKSNCPVTGQPDWASVEIQYTGAQIDRAGLLAYIVSYREHGDFHEQCVEQIFTDLLERCQPKSLSVYARYVRRGGLDINPYRCTPDLSVSPRNCRLSRQ